MKIQDMLCAEIDVLLASKVGELVDTIELTCWRKRNEKERLPSLPLIAVPRHKKKQTRFQFRFVETAGMVKRERHIVNEKKSHNVHHFISCRFYQRSWFSKNHFEMR